MRSKWLIVALIASLAGNLALGGFVFGRLGTPAPVPAALDPSLGMFRVLRELPEARREALRPPLREHFRSLRGDLQGMREAQRRINRALAGEPFDATALETALQGFRTALLDSQEHNHAMLVRLAGAMTAEERQLLRDAMTRSRRHRGPERGEGQRPPR